MSSPEHPGNVLRAVSPSSPPSGSAILLLQECDRPNAATVASVRRRSEVSLEASSWQVDIPKLAEVVMSLGAEGLKRIQLSGVDIHTIGCIEALG